MQTLRATAIAAFSLLTFLGAVIPAGSSVTALGCGPAIAIRDPALRASFAHFDRNQTSVAARLCAGYRNEMELAGR